MASLDRAQVSGKVETALLDAGFFSESILETIEQHGIELLCPEGKSWNQDWNKQFDKQFFKNRFSYQVGDDSYLCPHQQRLTHRNSCSGVQSSPAYIPVNACDACGRTIKRCVVDAKKDALRVKMGLPEQQRQRYR